MPFIPAIKVIKLVPEFNLPGGNKAYNTLHVYADGLAGPTWLELAITLYAEWWGEVADTYVSNQVALASVTATDLTIEGGLTVVEPFSPPVNGADVGAAMPANVTLATSFRTGYSGRSNRGRAYWVGLSEGAVTGDFVTNTVANGIRSAWEAFGLIMSENEMQHVVVSYVNNGLPRVTAQVRSVTDYINVDNRVDTQRRRLP